MRVYHRGKRLYLDLIASLINFISPALYNQGSLLLVSMWAWDRKKGWNAAAWYHLTKSSPSGLPKKPPTSAPQKPMPSTLRERHMGMEASRWPHSAVLSPVQMAAYLWLPAKALLVKMKGRSLLSLRTK